MHNVTLKPALFKGAMCQNCSQITTWQQEAAKPVVLNYFKN